MSSESSLERASCNFICEILKAFNNKRIVGGVFYLEKAVNFVTIVLYY